MLCGTTVFNQVQPLLLQMTPTEQSQAKVTELLTDVLDMSYED